MRNVKSILEKFIKPSKEEVREWLKVRQLKQNPPPNIEKIRLELWLKLVEPVVGELIPILWKKSSFATRA